MLVMGPMIGSGNFIVSVDMMRNLSWILAHRSLDYYRNYDGCSRFKLCMNFRQCFQSRWDNTLTLQKFSGKRLQDFYGQGNVYRYSNRYHCSSCSSFWEISAHLFPALNDAARFSKVAEFKITWIQIIWYCGDFVAHSLHQY